MLIALCIVVLMISGCVTAPPATSVGSSVTPKVIGPESGYSGMGMAGAHDWTDDDARSALWFQRNLPEGWAGVPFSIMKLFSYNIHDDSGQFTLMPFEWEYYFADIDDPSLQVRMFTVEARDRNRVRQEQILEKQAVEGAAAEKAVTGDVSVLSDEAVQEQLQIVYP